MMSPSSKDSQNKLGGLRAKKAAGLLVVISKASPAGTSFEIQQSCRQGDLFNLTCAEGAQGQVFSEPRVLQIGKVPQVCRSHDFVAHAEAAGLLVITRAACVAVARPSFQPSALCPSMSLARSASSMQRAAC